MMKENINISQSKQSNSRFNHHNNEEGYDTRIKNNVVLVKSSYLRKLDENNEEEKEKNEKSKRYRIAFCLLFRFSIRF